MGVGGGGGFGGGGRQPACADSFETTKMDGLEEDMEGKESRKLKARRSVKAGTGLDVGRSEFCLNLHTHNLNGRYHPKRKAGLYFRGLEAGGGRGKCTS